MSREYRYEIHENQFNHYYYEIYQQREFVSRSPLFKWEEECAWEACTVCDDWNRNQQLHQNSFC